RSKIQDPRSKEAPRFKFPNRARPVLVSVGTWILDLGAWSLGMPLTLHTTPALSSLMPKYNYVAMDAHGKESKGTLEVASQNEAIGRVKEMGLFPTKIVEVDKAKEKDKAGDKKSKPATGAMVGGKAN